MTAFSVLALILWFGLELAYHDLSRPAPAEPYRLDRWKDLGRGK